MEIIEQKSAVCPSCDAEIHSLHLKERITTTYGYNPKNNELERLWGKDERTSVFTCPACGAELATSFVDAGEFFDK